LAPLATTPHIPEIFSHIQDLSRYFNLPNCIQGGGGRNGANPTGVELHSFLSYLVKWNIEGRGYRVFGKARKQKYA
jgi:CDP-paratose 2-epimerase